MHNQYINRWSGLCIRSTEANINDHEKRKEKLAIIGTIVFPSRSAGFDKNGGHLDDKLGQEYRITANCSGRPFPQAVD